jgi:1,4-dihydroxy-2-naphthoate octaprenyltransferase
MRGLVRSDSGTIKVVYNPFVQSRRASDMADNFDTVSLIQKWLLAIRPKTLTAAVAPVVLGWGIAATTGTLRWGAGVAALFGAVMIQIGTNLVNDVVDFSKGADTAERTGPTRVTQTGLLSSRQVWMGVLVTFGLAGLAGLYLTLIAGWPIALLGLAALLAGIAYTAGPLPLAYIGLGDFFAFIFFGFGAVCGTVFVTAGALPESAWWAGAASGALIVNILVVNNIRDIHTDRIAGRKNIPVVLGRVAAEWEFALMLVLAFAVPPILICKGLASPWVMLAYISLPQGVKLWSILRSGLDGPPLNPILGQTAQMVLRYAFLFAFGLILGLI